MSYVDIKKLMARTTESSSVYREYGLMLGVPKIIMKMGTDAKSPIATFLYKTHSYSGHFDDLNGGKSLKIVTNKTS